MDLSGSIHGSVWMQYSELIRCIRLELPECRPRNSFSLVVANFCYQVQDQVAKLILWLQNCTYIFYAMKIY